jgi:hypothetical protein
VGPIHHLSPSTLSSPLSPKIPIDQPLSPGMRPMPLLLRIVSRVAPLTGKSRPSSYGRSLSQPATARVRAHETGGRAAAREEGWQLRRRCMIMVAVSPPEHLFPQRRSVAEPPPSTGTLDLRLPLLCLGGVTGGDLVRSRAREQRGHGS